MTSFMPPSSHNFSMSLNSFNISSKKRTRDEDHDELQQVHESKRVSHSLPFRISPTTKHTRLFSPSKGSKPKPLFTQTLTPADSEEESSPLFSTINSTSTQVHSEGLIAQSNDTQDCDLDMMDVALSPRQDHSEDMAMVSPNASPRTLLPQKIDPKYLQEVGSNDRLPTPIYGHFQQLSKQSQINVIPNATETTPPHSKKEKDYDFSFLKRLPSPISEDEAMDFPAAPKNSPLETSAPFETCSPEPQPRGLRTPARMAQPLTGQSPPKGKIVFSMGFRADCEMCRKRVPGHSNHIFRVS